MKKFLKKYLEFFIVFGLIFMFAVFYLWDSIVITIFPGHAGVHFRRFFNKGTVIEQHYKEGTHFILPWNKMYVYDVRIQELKQKVEVLSQNGLTIRVVVSVRYFLLKEEVPLIHQKIGEQYRDKVIIPSTISSVREVIGKYLPEQLYTTARHVIQDEILIGTIEETGRLPIIYSDMIIELIKLPDMINKAIESKLKHQQEYLEYRFKISKAEEEKKRQIIEASGIKIYQEIITQSLSDPLLKWQGIKATTEIAKSENAKIIIIGGKDGLPVILNTGDNGVQQPLPKETEISIDKKNTLPGPTAQDAASTKLESGQDTFVHATEKE
ncbi:MAG: prohibitin family protein [Deltaproteobacteria bacterium]|nr:prohibitin family protein [Deltaproteobacteria bacterium]